MSEEGELAEKRIWYFMVPLDLNPTELIAWNQRIFAVIRGSFIRFVGVTFSPILTFMYHNRSA
jgi:hypothetical protein